MKRLQDFMTVTVEIDFRAKENPDNNDSNPMDVVCQTYGHCLPADEDGAAYLEAIVKAIREQRLFGFMQQECAEAPVAAGEWIEKTASDMLAEQQQNTSTNNRVVPIRPKEEP